MFDTPRGLPTDGRGRTVALQEPERCILDLRQSAGSRSNLGDRSFMFAEATRMLNLSAKKRC
jgi:hypothetical protein